MSTDWEDEAESMEDRAMVDSLMSMPATSKQAMTVWRKMYPKYHGWLPEFTGKQAGQFKQWVERAPDGRQLAVLGFSIRYWSRLTRKQKAPKKPHIGWLLAHVGDAVDFMDHWFDKKSTPKPKRGEELTVGEL